MRLGLKAKGTRGRRAREGGGSRAQASTQAGPPPGFPRHEHAGGALPRQFSAVEPCAGRGRRRPRPRPRPAGPVRDLRAPAPNPCSRQGLKDAPGPLASPPNLRPLGPAALSLRVGTVRFLGLALNPPLIIC